MNILLFGILADVTGKSSMELNAVDTDSLRKELLNRFPALNQYRFQVAVNKKLIKSNMMLSDHHEIALLPPFAGG